MVLNEESMKNIFELLFVEYITSSTILTKSEAKQAFYNLGIDKMVKM